MQEFIKKEKLSNQLCRYIQDKILFGEYEDGERIVETKIAREFNVSQSPVREALRELEAMGLVEARPYSGCVVRAPDEKRIKQIYELRSFLEAYAAREGIPNLTDEHIQEMESVLTQMQLAAKENDIDTMSKCDVLLHQIVVTAAENYVLERMWKLVGAYQWTQITMSVHHDLNYFLTSHVKLFAFAKSRDIDSYCRELELHFSTAADSVSAKTKKR